MKRSKIVQMPDGKTYGVTITMVKQQTVVDHRRVIKPVCELIEVVREGRFYFKDTKEWAMVESFYSLPGGEVWNA